MSCNDSFFLVRRGVFDHHLFERDEYSRRDAWLWLVSKAAFADRQQTIGNRTFNIKRGDAIHSIRSLAKIWRWGEKKVRVFLDLLENEGMIEKGTVEGTVGTQITVCNYSVYQSSYQSEGTVEGTDRAQLGHNNKEIKKEKNKTRVPACAPTREYNTTTKFECSAEPEQHFQLAKQALTEPSRNQPALSLVSNLNVAPAQVTPEPVSVSSEQIDLEEAIAAATMADALRCNHTPPGATMSNGRVVLSAVTRDRWLKQFDAEQLDLALIQISAYVQPNSFRSVEQQVEAQLSRIALQRKDQDRRYQAAVQANATKRPQHPVDREEAANRAYYDELKRKYKVGEYAGTA